MIYTITADITIAYWAALVRNVLFNLGFGYAWIQHGVINRTYFNNLFKRDYVINTASNGLLQSVPIQVELFIVQKYNKLL